MSITQFPFSKRILFVDDEERILRALIRRIKAMHPDWELSEASGGQQALQMLEQAPYDLVVSDLQMPIMDGAAFLAIVRERYPRILRFALSGHAQQELMLKAISLSHQYFAKPCDTTLLANTIEESLKNANAVREQKLKEVIVHLNQFPLTATVYAELVSALNDPNKGIDRIAEIISHDPSMAAKVMQIANSSFFGAPQNVGDLKEAAALLGTDAIHAIALMFKIFESIQGNSVHVISQAKLCEHSFKVAGYASRLISSYFNRPDLKEAVHTAALLHDLGKLILADFSPAAYGSLLETSKEKKMLLWRLEEEAFGLSHGDVGALLFELWGLPKEVCQYIRYHHAPGLHSAPNEVLSALHIADVVDYMESPQEEFYSTKLDVEYLTKNNLPVDPEFWREWARKNMP